MSSLFPTHQNSKFIKVSIMLLYNNTKYWYMIFLILYINNAICLSIFIFKSAFFIFFYLETRIFIRQVLQGTSINRNISQISNQKSCLLNMQLPHWVWSSVYYKLRSKSSQKATIIQILCNWIFYRSIVSIATLALDCVYTTLKRQRVILSKSI